MVKFYVTTTAGIGVGEITDKAERMLVRGRGIVWGLVHGAAECPACVELSSMTRGPWARYSLRYNASRLAMMVAPSCRADKLKGGACSAHSGGCGGPH